MAADPGRAAILAAVQALRMRLDELGVRMAAVEQPSRELHGAEPEDPVILEEPVEPAQDVHSRDLHEGWDARDLHAQELYGPQDAWGLHVVPDPRDLHGRQEARDLHGRHEARDLHGRREARDLHGRQEARDLHGRREARELHAPDLHGLEFARGLHGAQRARGLHGAQNARGLYGLQDARGLHGGRFAPNLHGNRRARELHEEFLGKDSDIEDELPLPPQRRVRPHRRREFEDPFDQERAAPRIQAPSLKLSASSFAGKVDPEAYLDWERRMEHVFEVYDYEEPRKVQFAAAQLTDHALTWWDREQQLRRRNREGPVSTWDVMKFIMRRRYIPPMYHRELQKKFRKLIQGSLGVEEYYEEFEHLRNRLQLEDDEETLMAQFLDGLQERIVRKVERQTYYGFEELLHLAIQIEAEVKRKSATLTRARLQAPTPAPWAPRTPATGSSSCPIDKGKAPAFDPRAQGHPTIPAKDTRAEVRPDPNVQRTRDIECFKCRGRGHYARECPNQRVMIITPSGELESQGEEEPEEAASKDTEEAELEYPETGEILVARRVLSTAVVPTETDLRDNIFYTRCLASHHLLGRSCQFDREAIHNGRSNHYTVMHDRKKYTLTPLLPAQIHELHIDISRNKAAAKSNFLIAPSDSRRASRDCSSPVLLMIVQGFFSAGTSLAKFPRAITNLMVRYKDVFPEDIPAGLPPQRGMEHHMDLVPRAHFPNRPSSRVSSLEAYGLEKQMAELMTMECLQKNTSPCIVPLILSLFEIVWGSKFIAPVYFITLLCDKIVGADRVPMAEYLQRLYGKLRGKLKKQTKGYEKHANKGRREVMFQPDDGLWLHRRPERFQQSEDKQNRGLERISDDRSGHQGEFHIYSPFNVSDLAPFDPGTTDHELVLRSKPLQEGGNDEDSDSLLVPEDVHEIKEQLKGAYGCEAEEQLGETSEMDVMFSVDCLGICCFAGFSTHVGRSVWTLTRHGREEHGVSTIP